MTTIVKPKGFRIEIQDRVHIKIDEIESNIVNHPYYLSGINPKFNEAIDIAIIQLSKAYQLADKLNEEFKKIDLDELSDIT